MTTQTILINVVLVVCGGLVTAFVAWLFYQKAARDLNKSAKIITRKVTIVLEALEEHGLGEFTRRDGEVVGNVKYGELRIDT
jgi:hypothetical protein